MAKGKRLTVRLDDELDNAIMTGCQNGNCDKTTVVINALKRGFGLSQDQQAGEARPAAAVASTLPAAGQQKEIVQGKIRHGTSVLSVSKAQIIEVIEDDGTRHQYKDGKIVACKRPGKNWQVFLQE